MQSFFFNLISCLYEIACKVKCTGSYSTLCRTLQKGMEMDADINFKQNIQPQSNLKSFLLIKYEGSDFYVAMWCHKQAEKGHV